MTAVQSRWTKAEALAMRSSAQALVRMGDASASTLLDEVNAHIAKMEREGWPDPASISGPVDDARIEALEAKLDGLRTGVAEDVKRLVGMTTDQVIDLGKRVADMEKAKAITVEIRGAAGAALPPGGTVVGARRELKDLLEVIGAEHRNLWLTGPKGSGKSTLGEQLAQALGVPLTMVPCNEDMTQSVWFGSGDAHGKWHESAFASTFDQPGVTLVDEADAARATVLLAINAPLANDILPMPRHHDPERRLIKRHPMRVLVFTANTWGFGATAEYCGRSPQDSALLDRFVGGEFSIDYDRETERRILSANLSVLHRLWTIRESALQNRIRRSISTRAMVSAAKLHRAGFSEDRIISRLLASWTPQEKAKVGVAA